MNKRRNEPDKNITTIGLMKYPLLKFSFLFVHFLNQFWSDMESVFSRISENNKQTNLHALWIQGSICNAKSTIAVCIAAHVCTERE